MGVAGTATPPKAPTMQQPPAHKMMNRRPRGVRGNRPASSDKPSGLLQEGGRVSRWKGRRPGMASRAWSGLPVARRAVWEETWQSVGSGPHTASPRVDLYQVGILRRLFQLHPCALVSGVFRPPVPSCSSPCSRLSCPNTERIPGEKKSSALKKSSCIQQQGTSQELKQFLKLRSRSCRLQVQSCGVLGTVSTCLRERFIAELLSHQHYILYYTIHKRFHTFLYKEFLKKGNLVDCFFCLFVWL